MPYKDPEKAKENARQYYQKNKEWIAEKDKQRYQENRERILEQKKQYHQENKERIAEQKKQRYQENRERILEQKKQYHQENKEQDTACLYSILNKMTDQSYIGETMRFEGREREHKTNLNGGRHYNRLLQKDYDKYGADAFEFSMVREINKEDFQSEKELKEYLRVEEAKLILEEAEAGKELYNLALNPTYIVAVLKERLGKKE